MKEAAVTRFFETKEFWGAASSLVWVLLILIVFVVFLGPIRSLLISLVQRVKAGALVKTPWFEISTVNVTKPGASPDNLQGITFEIDKGEKREFEKTKIYEESRRMMLCHKVLISQQEGQLYDILIYIVSHKSNQGMKSIKCVRYYIGAFWGHRIFVSNESKTGFAIAISAYGPTLCTAELEFIDGERYTLARYLDFEMGPLPAADP